MGPITQVKSNLVDKKTNYDDSICTQSNISNSAEEVLDKLITHHNQQNITITQQKNMSGKTLNISIDNKIYELEVTDFIGMVIDKIYESINSLSPNRPGMQTVEILKAINTATKNYKSQHNNVKICDEDIEIINYLINNTMKNRAHYLESSDSQILQTLIGLQSHYPDNPNYNYSLGALINEYSEKLAKHSDITQHLGFAAALIASAG